MNGKLQFQHQMDLLDKKIGKESLDETYVIYAAMTKWLWTYGYGTIELNAVHNKFSSKMHFRTIGDSNDMIER